MYKTLFYPKGAKDSLKILDVQAISIYYHISLNNRRERKENLVC